MVTVTHAPAMRLVETPEDIRASVGVFNRATRPIRFLRDIVRRTTYWIYDPETGGFGPGKFVGFRQVSVRTYLRARRFGSSADRADGTVTRTRIEGVLGEPFTESRRHAAELRKWAQAFVGEDVFEGIDASKWKFLALKADAARRPPQSGRVAGQSSPLRNGNKKTAALGEAYEHENENRQTKERDPFKVDPDVVDRGKRGHAATQNALAAFLRENGIEPHAPVKGTGCDFDLGWEHGGVRHVAEVKSLTKVNEEKQLRLGLGQVLRYRQTMAQSGKIVVAVLAVEREPADPSWTALCEELSVKLVWPEAMERLLEAEAEASDVA